jgi:5'-nucleotidase/UDP-sugar diphosphatase
MNATRKNPCLYLIFLLVLALLTACSSSKTTPTSSPAPTPTQPATSTLAPPLPAAPLRLTVLYTNDEHGWMEGVNPGEGAANLMGLWKEKEGYTPDGAFLILSGGDNWTGPAISTWFQGLSMVEVMNAMGYAASAVGNHEFDFGLDTLKQRISEAHFPYVSANLRYKSDGSTPADLGIQPYTIVDVGGLRVGITGLTTYATATTTDPTNIKDFDFIDYATALRETVPQLRTAGAQIILVAAHVCPDELAPLAKNIQDLDIQLLGGGHCEQTIASKIGNTVLLTGRSWLQAYGVATFEYDPASQAIGISQYAIRDNQGGSEDPAVAAVVARWHESAQAQLDVQIGYLKQSVTRNSTAMRTLIVESWLKGYPTADAAISNSGGIRADLKAGPVTLADLIGVMPFDDVLIDVKLTGKQLTQVLNAASSPVVGGLHRLGAVWIDNKTGQQLETDTTYSVLVNDFMYNGGDGYTLLAQYDPNAYNTSINWRQPVIDWIQAQHSTPADPLDEAIRGLSQNP